MKVSYEEYMMWRRHGLRAVTAFGIAKFGLSFLIDFLSEEER